MMLRSRHAVLSLTTRFRLPHEGMTEMEYLSRGSACLLDVSTRSGRSTLPSKVLDHINPSKDHWVVLTCQHVACPWLFPNYFADKWDWLQHVSEEFVQHSLQLLENDNEDKTKNTRVLSPRIVADIPLETTVWLHPNRDLAMLSLHEDALALDIGADLQPLVLNPTDCSPGDMLVFIGHKQTINTSTTNSEDGSDGDESEGETDGVGQYPKQVPGRFVGQSMQRQAFAWSEEVLEEGMCGGAVVNEFGECVGVIEGIVPPFSATSTPVVSSTTSPEEQAAASATTRMRKALENHVAFISSTDVHEFVQDDNKPCLETGTGLGLIQDDDDDALW